MGQVWLTFFVGIFSLPIACYGVWRSMIRKLDCIFLCCVPVSTDFVSDNIIYGNVSNSFTDSLFWCDIAMASFFDFGRIWCPLCGSWESLGVLLYPFVYMSFTSSVQAFSIRCSCVRVSRNNVFNFAYVNEKWMRTNRFHAKESKVTGYQFITSA